MTRRPNGDLERYALQRARTVGIGREVDRRGMLFVYDVATERLRIEVGPTLEGFFTDGFLGYLMRDHVRAFFAADDPALGLRLTLFMIQHRMREGALGREYDPRPVTYIRDSVRLAAGGGATARVARGSGGDPFLRGGYAAAARAHFAPQPTVSDAYARYLEWLRDGRFQTELPLFTSASRDLLQSLPMTRAYNDYILLSEYGQPYVVDERGDLALLVFTGTPLVSPHFFRRTAAGWQMDLAAEVANNRNYAGGAYTWSLFDGRDEFGPAFADRWVRCGPVWRHAAGDNRPLPVRGR